MSYQRTAYSSRNVETLKRLIDLIESSNAIGIIKLEPMKGNVVQDIRAKLREDGNSLVIAKNTLMKLAIEKTNVPGTEQLLPYISGSCAFLFSNGSAFKVAKFLQENKFPAPARPGQIAPVDVVVEKMNTGVGPGSFINELNSVGLPTRIERGTIAISEDTTVIKAGEVVSRGLASILARLGITPFEVGLSLEVVVQDGQFLDKEALLTDWAAYIASAHQQAVNLAFEIEYVTDDTTMPLLTKAHRQALSLAVESGYVSEDNAEYVLGAAQAKVIALIAAIKDADPNALPSELSELATAAPAPTQVKEEEEQPEEEEPEDEVSEEDMGLGSLFG